MIKITGFLYILLPIFLLTSFIQLYAEEVNRLNLTTGDKTGTLILIDLYDKGIYSNLVISIDDILFSYKLNDYVGASLDDEWTAHLIEGDIFKSFKIMLKSPEGEGRYMIKKEGTQVDLIAVNQNNFSNLDLSDNYFSFMQNSNMLIITKKSNFMVYNLSVFDVNGSIISTQNADQQQYVVDMKSLSSGVYFIETKLYDKVVLKKLNYTR
jgi:hypothetical protein